MLLDLILKAFADREETDPKLIEQAYNEVSTGALEVPDFQKGIGYRDGMRDYALVYARWLELKCPDEDKNRIQLCLEISAFCCGFIGAEELLRRHQLDHVSTALFLARYVRDADKKLDLECFLHEQLWHMQLFTQSNGWGLPELTCLASILYMPMWLAQIALKRAALVD